jgi:hypothetical protein
MAMTPEEKARIARLRAEAAEAARKMRNNDEK